ncbi:MAG: hypothetical protein PHX61_08140 [Alphaproteobacteria bacterium]|nr:hypothetical protein [Alphaproteobacteria bacterium]
MKGYFLLLDKNKNTVLLPTDDEFITDMFRRNNYFSGKIKRHKTKTELNTEISDFLKGGYKDESC